MGLFNRNKKQDLVAPVVTPQRPVVIRNVLPQVTSSPTGVRLTNDKGEVRGFMAAETNNMNFNWLATTTSINDELRSALTIMRSRCRERVKNDDYAKAYVNMCVSNVIGPKGIRLQALIQNVDGSRDNLAIEAIENSWSQWAKYGKNVDVTGKSNWKAIQEQLIRIYATDGEVFIRHIEGKDAGKFGYCIQVIDPSLCDETYNTVLENGNSVELGIEIDKYGKPIAYYFTQFTQPMQMMGSTNRLRIRVPASEIVHLFKTEFAGQLRGIPPMATSLPRMQMLAGFEDSALQNAQIGARKMGFYTSDGSTDDLTTGANSIDQDGQLVNELQMGTMIKLPPGVGVQKFETEYPNAEMGPFKKSMLRGIAVGLNVDYFTLNSDLESVNLSSARVAINETREVWKAYQSFVISNVVTEIYERWLVQALVRDLIRVKGQPLSVMNIEKYKNVNWIGRRWAYSDPQKDTGSNVELINNRIKSLTSVCNEIGVDFESEVELMVKDEALLESYGLMRVSQLPTAVEAQTIQDMQDNMDASTV